MKQKLWLLMFAATLHLCASAQLRDDFSDGDLYNPQWYGDDSLFTVNASSQLQSKGTTGKDICLSVAYPSVQNCEWSFWIRNTFSPSTQNFSRFYLLSDMPGLKGSLNGYYIQVGGVTGNTDSITLYKQKANLRTRIIAGRPGTVSKTANTLRIKVLRDSTGTWQVFSDTTGGRKFVPEGSGRDSEFTAGSYAGYFCRFTAGNAGHFYLDDVYIGPEQKDTLPPSPDSAEATGPQSVRVVFSEEVDHSSAWYPGHYTLDHQVGNPLKCELQKGTENIYILTFAATFSSGTFYKLKINGVSDLNGNTCDTSAVFYYYDPQAGDLLISEFLPDPLPQVLLPAQEFVELYNPLPLPVMTKGWKISDGTSDAKLPDIMIQPGEFVIICSEAHRSLFELYGKVWPVPALPSLNNASDHIIIKDGNGKVIHHLSYDLSWYRNTLKSDGGWSIELISPLQMCKGKRNYTASEDPAGGTPGKRNSQWSMLPDTVPPLLSGVSALCSDTLRVVFNEAMDISSVLHAEVNIEGVTIGKKIPSENGDTLWLCISSVQKNVSYPILIGGAADCGGISAGRLSGTFSWLVPEPASQSDVLIHEIMADPDPAVGLPPAEYAELYNRSKKIISLSGWTFMDLTSTAVLPPVILFPDSFIVITSSSHAALFKNICNAYGLASFPSLGNDAETLTLRDASGKLVHQVVYTSEFYGHPVRKHGGWSLEMIDTDNPCGGSINWKASADKNGGTPGRKNSVKGRSPDRKLPFIRQLYPADNRTLRVTFSEPMLQESALSTSFYHINPAMSIQAIDVTASDPSRAFLHFSDTLDPAAAYSLVMDSAQDCALNLISNNGASVFAIPHEYDSSAVTLNELLFNPVAGNVDFAEIFNRSDKVIDLKKLYIANADDNDSVKDYYPVASEGALLFPHCFAVFTTDPLKVRQQYFSAGDLSFYACKMPSYNDNSGKCILLVPPDQRYDQLTYDDKMHFPLLDTRDGVSLEKIDPFRSSKERGNWTSAAASAGFATPGLKNSQFLSGFRADRFLSVAPEVFSPDNDGHDDVVRFVYLNDVPGYTANMFIYDSKGRMVKRLLKNEIMGMEGVFTWDGIAEDGLKAGAGIYTVYFEMFSLNGEVRSAKKTLVVAAKL